MISKELQDKLDIYEQVYNSLDLPIPFKDGLKLYPVMVKDYYTFYSSFGCLTLDKTVKNKLDENGNIIKDKFGKIEKVPNIEGIAMSNLGYLISKMEENSEEGRIITNQVMQLFELIFHEKLGVFCPKCGKVVLYEELFKQVEEKVKEYADKLPEGLSKEDKDKAMYMLRIKAILDATTCECGEKMRDIISIKDNGGFKVLVVKNTEISPKDFDEMRAIVPRQNILDYDDDKYIDPDLKEELEIKKKLLNKDYTSPTLEKQMICVCTGTSYTIEELKNDVTMRKLSYLLRVVDRKLGYQIQMTAAMSGFVKMDKDPEHWIFSENKNNIAKEMTDAEQFVKKFDRVT